MKVLMLKCSFFSFYKYEICLVSDKVMNDLTLMLFMANLARFARCDF